MPQNTENNELFLWAVVAESPEAIYRTFRCLYRWDAFEFRGELCDGENNFLDPFTMNGPPSKRPARNGERLNLFCEMIKT